MNAAEQLYEQYQRDLARLQESCPHEQLTDWTEEWWAHGHSTGREVRSCTRCNKVVQARRLCQECFDRFLEEELLQGDGRLLQLGGWYCEPCYTQAQSRARRYTAKP